MKLTSLLLGLSIGSVGTVGFYAYSFDKSEYDWIAPQSVRAELSESTAILGNKTDGLLKNIETWTGIEFEPIKGSLIQLAGSVKAEEGHKDDDHGDEKGHGHSEDGHKDDDHGDEKEHAHGNDDDGHGHEEEDVIRLTASQQQEFGIELGSAKALKLGETINLPGEVKFNGDRVAHVVPRVKGIVTSVSARQGDHVKAGDVLAVLESRELADIKSQYLASIGRLEIVQATFEREEQLRAEQISTEQAFLEAKGAVAEAKIVLRTIKQQLLALGFNEGSLKRLRDQPEAALTPYKLIAPFDGYIISRHVTLGETVDDSNEVFVIADMSDLWVDFQIFPKDLAKVKQGQTVKVLDERGSILSESKITFIAPQIQEETRTGIARLQIPTSGSLLRPGMFITASVEVGIEDKVFTIPKTAPQIMNEKTVVFVQKGDGFEAKEVSLGRTQGDLIEVKGGLDTNTPIVVAGAFVLKAQLSKAQFGDGHNH